MKNIRAIDILSILFTIGYFSILGALMFHVIPDANKDVFNALLGVMTTIMLKIADFYHSKGAGAPK